MLQQGHVRLGVVEVELVPQQQCGQPAVTVTLHTVAAAAGPRVL